MDAPLGLFFLARYRQGQRSEALQLEELNLLREARGLPPLEMEPMISQPYATGVGVLVHFMIWTFLIVFVVLPGLALLYIVVHALLFGIPNG